MGQIKPWIFRAFLKGEEGQQNGVLCSQAGWQRLTLHIDVLVKDFLQTAIFAVSFPPHPPRFSHRLREHHRAAIKVIRRMQYFVAKKKFQVSCEQKAPFLNKPFYSPDPLFLLET